MKWQLELSQSISSSTSRNNFIITLILLTSLIIIINTEFIIISVIFIIITVVTVALNLGKQIRREDLTWQDVLVTAWIFLEKRRWIGWIARIPRYSSFSHTRPHELTHTDTSRHTGTHRHKTNTQYTYTHTHTHTHTQTHSGQTTQVFPDPDDPNTFSQWKWLNVKKKHWNKQNNFIHFRWMLQRGEERNKDQRDVSRHYIVHS